MSFKKLIGTFLIFLLASGSLSAITTRGGLISTDLATGGICFITSQLLIDQIPTSQDSAIIDWGDGMFEHVALTGWPMSSSNGSYIITMSGIWHTFSNGTYNIILTCGKRVSWIRNISSSGNSDFALQAIVVVDPLFWNSSSVISDSLNLEAEMITGSPNVIPLSVYNGDNDSVVWSLSFPLGATGYSLPAITGGGLFNLLQSQGQYEWNPVTPGLYTAAFTFTESRELAPGNWSMTCSVTREVLIDAGQVSGFNLSSSHTSCMLYPNPASDAITLKFSDEQHSRVIVIYDAFSREVRRDETDESSLTISVQEFAEGIYFYSVIEENGATAKGKFLVQ